MAKHSAHDFEGFVRAGQRAEEWLDVVAAELGTSDRRHAYHLLRAWMHTTRDRVGVDAAAHFAAQLPMLLRGLFFDGWRPSRVPVKYDAEQFLAAMAEEARVSPDEVRRGAPAVTAALARQFSPGQLEHLLAQLPAPVRNLIVPRHTSASAATADDDGPWR